MPTYKIILHSGQTVTAEDKRDLQALSADLCAAGFVVVKCKGVGYSTELTSVSLLERAVASIEPAK